MRDIEPVNQALGAPGSGRFGGKNNNSEKPRYRARWQHIRAEASHIVALGSHDDAGHVCDAPPRREESVLRSFVDILAV